MSLGLPLQTNRDRIKKEKLVELLREKKKLRGLKNLWFFDRHILNYQDMTSEEGFHGEMCKFIEPEGRRNILVLEPRGSLKTSCITIGYSLQCIARDPNIRILIASEEFNTACKFVSEIKGHIESNPLFKLLYGELKGEGKWSEKEIVVKNRTQWKKEPTITAAGIDVTKVGLHYDLIIVDDPHSTKNITTREQIEKVKVWYRLLRSLLDPGGKLVIIATRWHYDDLSGYLIEKERIRHEEGRKRRFRILIKKAEEADGALLWPERLSKEFLEEQKLDQGPYIYSCQYLNEPVDDESAIFKRSWVKFYDPKHLKESELVTVSVLDPMRDETGADFGVITTVSMDRAWRVYIREVRRGKWDEYDTIENLFAAYKRFKPVKMGVETVAWQKSYYRFIRAEMQRRQMKLPMMELKTDTRVTKFLRVKSMVPYWKSGLYLLPGTSIPLLKGNMAIMVDELLRYPRVSNDDCVDALAYTDQLIRRPMVSTILKKAPKGSFEAIRASIKANKNKFSVRQMV